MSLLNNFFEILYGAAANTFIAVGSFVGITLLLFGYINYRTEGQLVKTIEERKKLQVVFGALLGLTPGCGGAIMVMPLYLLGKVSFGAVVATLIATMGDAAFVIIVHSPKVFLYISVISFIIAVVTGYFIDFFNIGINLVEKISSKEELKRLNKAFEDEPTDIELNAKKANKHKYSMEGIFYIFRHNQGYKLFWILAVLGFILGIMDLMQIDLDNAFPIKNLRFIGALGTFFSVIYTIISKKIIKDDNIGETESKLESLKETLVHNAGETAFVISWIFMAFLFYEISIELLGGEKVLIDFMNKSGFIVVMVAVLIGLIPGCGPQIVLATLYVAGAIPFSALIANAICNDGDALFPLLAINKKSAMWATLYSLIPAVAAGGIFYLLGY
ncbi:putative manganese transporter [Fusobacterium sp. MFO224]|uniref:putative manganese transporter n=1 Tax=Fusobacterium sp. MFO224 TaxID=3378070 RepID=UPI00385427CA